MDTRAIQGIRSQILENSRLRFALLFVIFIIWVYGLFYVWDWVKRSERKLAIVNEEVIRLDSVIRDRVWLERLSEAKTYSEVGSGLLWNGYEVSLAQAKLQDDLRLIFDKCGVSVKSLAQSAPEYPAQEVMNKRVSVVRVRVNIEYKIKNLLLVFAELARLRPLVAVDRFVIRSGAPNSNAEVDLKILVPVNYSAATELPPDQGLKSSEGKRQ